MKSATPRSSAAYRRAGGGSLRTLPGGPCSLRRALRILCTEQSSPRTEAGAPAWHGLRGSVDTTLFRSGRWGQPSDLAGAAVFLASGASDYVHGTILAVDGGWLAR